MFCPTAYAKPLHQDNRIMKTTRRDFAKASAVLLALPLLSGAGQPAPPRRIEFTPQQTEDLDKISDYLNSIQTLVATFVQISGPGNVAPGSFYLARPGRLRFEYNPPNPVLIVATNERVYVQNTRLNTVDRYDVSDTPLGLLLAPDIDLKRNQQILGVDRDGGDLVLHARTSSNRTQSNVTIVFSAAPVELREWVVKDAQGGTTDVALTKVRTGGELPETLFAVPVKAVQARKSGN
jgi:outer membrane lipoprotein-sorting protein